MFQKLGKEEVKTILNDYNQENGKEKNRSQPVKRTRKDVVSWWHFHRKVWQIIICSDSHSFAAFCFPWHLGSRSRWSSFWVWPEVSSEWKLSDNANTTPLTSSHHGGILSSQSLTRRVQYNKLFVERDHIHPAFSIACGYNCSILLVVIVINLFISKPSLSPSPPLGSLECICST